MYVRLVKGLIEVFSTSKNNQGKWEIHSTKETHKFDPRGNMIMEKAIYGFPSDTKEIAIERIALLTSEGKTKQ